MRFAKSLPCGKNPTPLYPDKEEKRAIRCATLNDLNVRLLEKPLSLRQRESASVNHADSSEKRHVTFFAGETNVLIETPDDEERTL